MAMQMGMVQARLNDNYQILKEQQNELREFREEQIRNSEWINQHGRKR